MRKLWIALAAVIGVLLHAGALVRHHAAMLSPADATIALAADLSVTCRGMSAANFNSGHDLPPPPSTAVDCPICLGATSACAVLTGDAAAEVTRAVEAANPPAYRHIATARWTVGRPRARDPPVIRTV